MKRNLADLGWLIRMCFALCAMLFVALPIFSQNSDNIATTNKELWTDPNASEEERLDDLVERALLLIEKAEYENSYKYVARILDFELGRTSPKYQSCYVFFEACKIPYRDSSKIPKFQESIDLARKVDYKIIMSLSHTFIGICYRTQGNAERALEYWKKAINLAENTDDYHLNMNKGWSEIQIAMMMIKQGRKEEADKYEDEAFKTFWAIPDEPGVFYGYYELGMVCQEIRQYDKALEYFHKALPYTVEGNPFIHSEMANIYEAQGEWAKALKYLEYCRKQYSAMNRRSLEYDVMGDIGRMLLKVGDLNQAVKIAEELQQDAKKDKPLAPPYKVFALLGDIAFAQNKTDLAIEHYQTSLKLHKGEGYKDQFWPSNNQLVIGRAFLKQKNYAKAIKYCLDCEAYFEENRDFVKQEAVYETLYTAYKNLGNYSMALENLEKIIAIKKDKDPLETARHLQEYEFSKKTLADSLQQVEKLLKIELAYQTKLRINNRSKFLALGGGGFILLISLGLWSRLKFIQKSQQALEEKNKIIEAEKEKAKSSEQAKQQFLANMSHEIRTPMNAIKGMTDILLRRNPQSEQLSYLQAIKQSSNSLLVIINDILDISKIEAGKIDLEEIPFSLKETIQNVGMIVQFKAEEKGLLLQTDIKGDLVDKVVGDPTRLHQILLNLTSNAIKFTEKGMVTIQVKTEELEAGTIKARFCVSDTGVGIGEDRLEKIFESFEQAYSDTTRKFGGTGLGLSISKKLVEIQDGKIWAKSQKGKGSQFYFTISFKVDTREEIAEIPKAVSENENVGDLLKGVKILLVEDNQFNAIVAQEELEDAIVDVVVEVAENGVIAIEKVSHGDYDIILMDVQMPVMNGYEATRVIRNLSNGKSKTPIIAMTANVMKEEVERCYDAGMDDFIGKPFEVDELIVKIYKHALLKS